MELVHDVLPHLPLILNMGQSWLRQHLIWVVLCVRMLWEILHIFLSNRHVQVFEIIKVALCQQLKLLPPDDGDAHVLSSIGNDSAC